MCPNAYTINAIAPPCPRAINNTDCVVSSSPNAETAKITERGPKNTNP